MSDTKVYDRIRKLLALGENNPNEHEAEQALALAQRMMLQHGIERSQLEQAAVAYGDDSIANMDSWHLRAGWAVGELFGTRVVVFSKRDGTRNLTFVGRPDNVKTSVVVALSIIQQIERLYKQRLPKGLSKADRAIYRRDFKEAAALRVFQRAYLINQQLAKEEAERKASELGTSSSTALTLVDHLKELHEEADAFLRGEDIKQRKTSVKARVSIGGIEGAAAGEIVKLQEKVR